MIGSSEKAAQTPDFPQTVLTLTPGCPGVKKFLPTTGPEETHFLVRTSTIFGADVHDPKGCRKTLRTKKVCVDFLAPSTVSGSTVSNTEVSEFFGAH